MKKIFAILFIFGALSCAVMAEDDGGIWDNYGDTNFYGNQKQTAVSDEKFDKTIEKVKGNKKWFNIFSREKRPFKGDNLQQSNETEILKGIETETPVLTIPYPLKKTDGGVLPVGHYQVIVEKENGKVMMKFYQAHFMIAEFLAKETEEDLFDEYINYLTLDDLDETHAKINFGSIDFNAYAVVEKF